MSAIRAMMRGDPCIICKEPKPLVGIGSFGRCCLPCAATLQREEDIQLALAIARMNRRAEPIGNCPQCEAVGGLCIDCDRHLDALADACEA